MSTRTRVVLAVIWIVSLVAVSEWRADAQVVPSVIGSEVRFVQGKTVNGVVTGHLMANIGGAWIPVDARNLSSGGIVPLSK